MYPQAESEEGWQRGVKKLMQLLPESLFVVPERDSAAAARLAVGRAARDALKSREHPTRLEAATGDPTPALAAFIRARGGAFVTKLPTERGGKPLSVRLSVVKKVGKSSSLR
jgi:hypothetical protein